MRNAALVGMVVVLLSGACSHSAHPKDAAATDLADQGRSDVPGTSQADLLGGASDLAASGPDAGDVHVGEQDTAGGAPDRPDLRDQPEARDTAVAPEVVGGDAPAGELPAVRADARDAQSEAGEQCSCDGVDGTSASQMSWGCFCSVEDCGKTLAYFVDGADGGRVLRPTTRAVLLKEYADCNLVLVQANTYSDYVSASEYVFNLTTGALVGARVWLDDRQHHCPFGSGSAWVFAYQSGDYPVPTSCQVTACVAGSGSCPDAGHAG